MGAIDAPPVRGERQVRGAAPGQQAFGLHAAPEVDHRDIVAHAVGDVEKAALPIGYGCVGFEPRGQFPHHFEGGRIDDGYRVAPRIRHVQLPPVRRKRDAFWVLAHADASDHSARRRIQFHNFAGALAHYVEPASVGRRRDLDGRGIGQRRRSRHGIAVRAEALQGDGGAQQEAGSSHGYFSSTVITRSAVTLSSVCTVPLGQVTVNFSTVADLPSPKCTRPSSWER